MISDSSQIHWLIKAIEVALVWYLLYRAGFQGKKSSPFAFGKSPIQSKMLRKIIFGFFLFILFPYALVTYLYRFLFW